MAEEEEPAACNLKKEQTLEEFECIVNCARTMVIQLEDKCEELGIGHVQDSRRFPPLAYHLRKAREHLGQAWHITIDVLRGDQEKKVQE